MQYISTDFVGLVFIPFTLSIFLLLHLRNRAYFLDQIFQKINRWGDSKSKEKIIFILALSFAIIWSFIVGFVVFPFSDVDEAMVAGIQGFFINGINPYSNNIVPHILLLPSGEEIVTGPYNYGPVDLIIYGIGYFLFSPFFGIVWWLFVTNIIFLILIYKCISITYPDVPGTVKVIPFMLLMGWFMQDNAVLMTLFLSFAWLIHKKVDKKYKYPLITIILTLGVFTKLYLAFVILGYFVYEFKDNFKLWFQNIIVGGLTTVIVIFPFGMFDVIKSIFLFQTNLDTREEYAIISGGIPTILNLLGIKSLFIPIAIVFTLVILVFSYYYSQGEKEQLELKFAVSTIFFLLLLPNSVFAFFIIPVYFILGQYYENLISNGIS